MIFGYRMRKYVKRGGMSVKVLYDFLKKNVLDEIWKLDREQHVIHNNDIQHIAMIKAIELGISDFKVR